MHSYGKAVRKRRAMTLPAAGNDLRRTYKTIATETCRIPDDVSAYFIGHVPEGMSQKYLLRWALSSADAIKEAQAKISATVMRLLHAPPPRRKSEPPSHRLRLLRDQWAAGSQRQQR
jgi:hypothetical protein